jgi:hypothetical protein
MVVVYMLKVIRARSGCKPSALKNHNLKSALTHLNSVGTAVEHHTLYQYQFASTKDIFMGQIQTETA